MPVDYRLRNLRRLFGEASFLRPTEAKTSPPAKRSVQATKAAVPEAGREENRDDEGMQRKRKPSGGLPPAFFSEQPPRSVRGKAIGGHMFSVHLYEKQKMKLYYGSMRDDQFRRYVMRAKAKRFNTDAVLLRLLELRLDTFLYRTGFVKTPMQARQWLFHGQILVNGDKVDIKSFGMTPGDVLTIRTRFQGNAHIAQREAAEFRRSCGVGASWIIGSDDPAGMLPWMEIDRVGLAAALVREPTDEEVRALSKAALFPYIRSANMDPHAAMRAYR